MKRGGILLLLACLFACSTLAFDYKYYGLAPADGETELKGKLIAHDPKDNLPLSVCTPDDQVKGKCVVLLIDEFNRLQNDIIDCQDRLKVCESSK